MQARIQRVVSVIVAAVFATTSFSSVASSQDAPSSPREQLAILQREALAHLVGDELEEALDVLGKATDQSENEGIAGGNHLSAAAGGLHRKLAQLSTDEQYDLLHDWTLPTDSRKTVRMLTAVVPVDAPPKAFARALGERPRDDTFSVSQINGVRGLFSTGWVLVNSAADVGRLSRLISELEPLAADKVPNAEALLLIARLADSNAGDLSDVLRKRTEDIRKAGPQPDEKAVAGVETPVINLVDIVIAAAGLSQEPLRQQCENLLKVLETKTLAGAAPHLRPFLRVAHATAVQLNRGVSGPEVLYQNRLKYWVPVSGKTSASNSSGGVDTMWLVHEDHILHLAGSGNDTLFFRYPLTGDFDFTCETQEGGEMLTDGGLVYGGLHFEALGSTNRLTIWDSDNANATTKYCPFVRHENRATFNRVSIRSDSEGPKFAANLHPMWFDHAGAQASPWLGLRSFDARRPVFRNLKIKGRPVIPREVRLIGRLHLRGWQSGFFGETQPSFFTTGEAASTDAAEAAPAPTFDWRVNDGVLEAAKKSDGDEDVEHSLLRYQRPLLEGESVSYEYFYKPDEAEVHPALGRMAFLIEPRGIRVRWITDGDREWTGLPADNAVLEPLSRRNSQDMELKEGDWNKVTLARADGKVMVSLNGTLIYQRDVDFGGDLQFGLYRDRARSAVKVRNASMTGDWPEKLPEDCLANPSVVSEEPKTTADRRVLHQQTGDALLAQNVRHVRRAAAWMSPTQRFDYLARWVLPGPDHPTFRVSGEFRPLALPPPFIVASIQSGSFNGKPKASVFGGQTTGTDAFGFPLNEQNKESDTYGSRFESPVYDLLDTARELGRLDEVRKLLASHDEPRHRLQQRAYLALRALVSFEMGKVDDANSLLDRLYSLSMASAPSTLHDVWPESIVIHRLSGSVAGRRLIHDLLASVHQQWTLRSTPLGSEFWHTHIARLMGPFLARTGDGSEEAVTWDSELREWIPAVRAKALSRGDGNADVDWQSNSLGEIHHLSGHQEELLLFRSPLRGDFEFTCEMGGQGTTQLYSAGSFIGPHTLTATETGTFRRGLVERPQVNPALERFDIWNSCRVTFRDGICSEFFNGRKVRSRQVDERSDPWIGIRNWWRHAGRVRDLRITGQPTISDAVEMSVSPDLIGWVNYFPETVGSKGADWSFEETSDSELQHTGQIVGRRRDAPTGSMLESLLRYHRPLVEDGTVEYDFFYEPGSVATHPALDRLTFLLQEDGVSLHWITDGLYDRTVIPPGNGFEEPEHRRGPDKLPLVPGDWNRLQLSIAGKTVSLTLNGQLVFEWPLEPTNHRTFGLFHFADQTEVRVRNVVMKGDWPKTLAPVSEQAFASQIVAKLDEEPGSFDKVFDWNFAKSQLSGEYFEVIDPRGGAAVHALREGLVISRGASGAWSNTDLRIRFVLQGDFDVVATFDRYTALGSHSAAVMLSLELANQKRNLLRVVRNRTPQGRQFLQTSLAVHREDGTPAWQTQNQSSEARSGRMRLARRGDDVYYLFAEGESNSFQLVRHEVVPATDSTPDGFNLRTLANGDSTTTVVWKSLRVAADELLILPSNDSKPQNVIYVMNEDGSDLRPVTPETPNLGGHGSPDWSPDGKRLAFDIYDTRHSYLVNEDGTGWKDLGSGIMPTFGPYGKRLAYTGGGMSIMDDDGGNRETIINEGWGAQWSPDGRWIAYADRTFVNGSSYSNLAIIDIQTKEKRHLFEGDEARRYSSLYWNNEWSPDSRQICFKGSRKNGGTEMAITSVDGSSKGFRVITTDPVDTDFGWHPDGSRILLSKTVPAYKGPRLFVCDVESGEMTLLETQPMKQINQSAVWSPDGKRIAFVSRRTQEPRPWEPAELKSD